MPRLTRSDGDDEIEDSDAAPVVDIRPELWVMDVGDGGDAGFPLGTTPRPLIGCGRAYKSVDVDARAQG